MTNATLITLTNFGKLIEGAFQPEAPQVASSESELGQPLQRFATPEDILTKAAYCIEAGSYNYAFGFWYPSMKGNVIERKITFDPPREGASFRYSLSGWGIIHLRLYVTADTLQTRVAVNTEARAKSREARYPEMGPASAWDWRAVETYAFRLSRRLAAMGRLAPVVQHAEEAPALPDNPWTRRKGTSD